MPRYEHEGMKWMGQGDVLMVPREHTLKFEAWFRKNIKPTGYKLKGLQPSTPMISHNFFRVVKS